MGALRRFVAIPIAGGLAIASTMVASAQAPGTIIHDRGFTAATPAPGYQYPPTFYNTGQAFSVAFTLENQSAEPVTECFAFEVYYLADIDARQNHDEGFFYSDIPANQQETSRVESTLSFQPNEVKALTRGATLPREGYYQFDFGFCTDSPLKPRPGWDGPLVSGFVRAVTREATPTPTPQPTGGTLPEATQRPAALAITGGGPPVSDAGVLAVAAWLVLLAALSWSLLRRRLS